MKQRKSATACAAVAVATALVAGLWSTPAQAEQRPAVTTQSGDTTTYRDPGLAGKRTRSVVGVLEKYVVDAPQGNSTEGFLIRRPDGSRVPVEADLPSDISSGDKITAELVSAPNDTAAPVATATISAAGVSASAVPAAHKAYVVRVTNRGNIDVNVETSVDKMLGYWVDQSDGVVSSFKRVGATQSLVVSGWSASASDCGLRNPWSAWDQAAAKFPTVNFAAPRTHLIVVLPAACGSTGTVGVATVGTGISSGGLSMVTLDPANYSTGAHELGHNFGLGHANVRSVSGGMLEYWNVYSPMSLSIYGPGYAFGPPALDSPSRSRLGLARPGELRSFALSSKTARTSATFSIGARAGKSGQRAVVVVDPMDGQRYFVEWRDGKTLRDNSAAVDGPAYPGGAVTASGYRYNFPTGVVIQQAGTRGEIVLRPQFYAGGFNGALQAGHSFASPGRSVVVNVRSVGPSSATVTVSLVRTLKASKPKLKGKAQVGKTLKVRRGKWTKKTKFKYKWFAGKKKIKGAKKAKYTIASKYKRKKITVKVIGKKTGYVSVSRTSNPKKVKR